MIIDFLEYSRVKKKGEKELRINTSGNSLDVPPTSLLTMEGLLPHRLAPKKSPAGAAVNGVAILQLAGEKEW